MRALAALVLFLLAFQGEVWRARETPLRYRIFDTILLLGACLLLTGGH